MPAAGWQPPMLQSITVTQQPQHRSTCSTAYCRISCRQCSPWQWIAHLHVCLESVV